MTPKKKKSAKKPLKKNTIPKQSKKQSKKTKPKTKKITGEKQILNFLEKEKTTEDYFRDVVKKKTHVRFNDRTEKFSVHGKKKFAGELGISVSTLNRIIKTGMSKQDEKRLKAKINRIVTSLRKSGYEIKTYYNATKYFNRDNFTIDVFKSFFKKYSKKVKGEERLLFRAQIYAKMGHGYIIPEYNFSLYDTNFNEGVEKFFKEIRKVIRGWQSLSYFMFIFLVCEKHKIREI